MGTHSDPASIALTFHRIHKNRGFCMYKPLYMCLQDFPKYGSLHQQPHVSFIQVPALKQLDA